MTKKDTWDEKTNTDLPRAFALPNSADGIQMTVVHDEPPAAGTRRRVVEIWTAKRVYGLDENHVCVSVLDRETSKEEATHAFMNARLVGGQLKELEGMSVSHPLPLPGMNAVFEVKNAKARFGTTTKVERVVMRVMMTNVTLDPDRPVPDVADAAEIDETTRIWKGWLG